MTAQTDLKKIPFAACAFCLWACSTTTTLEQPRAGMGSKPGNCTVDFYADRNKKPARSWQLVTRAESHVQRNFIFGGKASLQDDAFAELRKRACALGADAVIIDDYIESSALEFSHVHVWASIVRYTGDVDGPANQR